MTAPARVTVRTIVNADDLGLSVAVNDRILGLMQAGRVGSATILANGPAAQDALARAKALPGCSFGVHLNVTEFRPLGRDPALSPLLDPDGTFRGWRSRGRLPGRLDRALAGAILAEWRAQVARVRQAGLAVAHVDSHHHAHTRPELLPALLRLVRAEGIGRVRTTRNLWRRGADPGPLPRLGKRLWRAGLVGLGGVRTTDLMGDLLAFLDNAASLRAPRTAEVMVHPGHPDYAEEERALTRDWWQGLPVEIRFTTWHEL